MLFITRSSASLAKEGFFASVVVERKILGVVLQLFVWYISIFFTLHNSTVQNKHISVDIPEPLQ